MLDACHRFVVPARAAAAPRLAAGIRRRARAVESKPPLHGRSTIYDVARYAGVSHQTVSRLLKGYEGIRPETREKVEQALRDLNYRPNQAARSLATSRSHRIGALAYEMFEMGPSKMMQGASVGAREAGYLLDIVSLDPSDDHAIDTAIQLLDQHDLAGIIASAPTERVRQALLAVPFSVPLYIEGELEDDHPSSPRSVNGLGTRLQVDHLVGLGHRRILYLSGPRQWFAATNGERAYEAALAAHGLPSMPALEGDWSARSGYDAAARIPTDGSVTAVVSANDQMALGVLRRLSERGVHVPQQISVVGFDDIPESQFFIPPLTTVRVDFDQQGRHAVGMLLSMIEGGDEPSAEGSPPPQLVARDSSGAARTR